MHVSVTVTHKFPTSSKYKFTVMGRKN